MRLLYRRYFAAIGIYKISVRLARTARRQNNNVWALDASAYFSRPAPRVVDGAEILAKIFHAEIFGEPTEKEAVRAKLNFVETD